MNLTSLIRDGLRAIQAGALPAEELEDVAHCGCTFEPGCWGTDGWHFSRYTVPKLYEAERARFARERIGWSVPKLRAAWAEWLDNEEREGRLDERGVHQLWKPYIGLIYAYERCPPYLEKYRAELEARDAGKKAENKKDYDKRERR